MNEHFPESATSVLTQTDNNTTLWIGHFGNDPTDHFGGQTFTCPAAGTLDNIQVLTTAVQCPGELRLSLHEFDGDSLQWGHAIAESTIHVESTDLGKWIRFPLPSVYLKNNTGYGFRLQSGNAMIGLGEAASDNQHPFTFGREWHADSDNRQGHFYNYFSLAFKVEMRA